MSDTPRTDAAIRNSDGQWSYPLRDTCLQLERELVEAREQRDTLIEAIRAWRRKSWKDCKCDHGYDGSMPLQGEKCDRCRLWDAVDLALAAVKGGSDD